MCLCLSFPGFYKEVSYGVVRQTVLCSAQVSVCLYLCLFVCLSIYLYVSVCPSAQLSSAQLSQSTD